MPQQAQSTPGFTPVATQAAGATPGFTPVQAEPAAADTSTVGKPAFSPGTYQLRPGGPVLDPNKSPLRTGIESLEGTMGIHNPTSAVDALKQAGTSFAGFAGNALKEPFQGMTPGEEFTPVLGMRAALAVPNLIARGIEGMAGGLESSIKDIAAGWRSGGQPNDWRSIAAGAGEFLGTKLQADAPEHVSRALKSAASLIERQPTVEQGKIGYVNAARNAVTKLDHAVRTQGVGARVQRVVDADKLDLARSGSEGKVDTTQAVLNASKVFEKTHMGVQPGGYPAQMTMDGAKALMTQLGRDASRLERSGKAPEAAAVWTEYDGLREATQKRAEELGMGREWSDYAKEFRNYLQLQGGLLGHITEGEHTAALDQIIKHQGQLPELQKWFDKYNVDMSPVRDAATEGGKLNELTKTSSNALMGKIKLLSRHPALGLPAVMGVDAMMHGAGVSGLLGGIIIPLIIAGKVGGLLDTMQVKSLLHDLKGKMTPEQLQVAPDSVGPLQRLHIAASTPPPEAAAPTATPTPSGPPPVAQLTPQEASALRIFLKEHPEAVADLTKKADAGDVAAQQELREKLQGRRKQNVGPPEGQQERRRSETAKQVEAARSSRAQSGVYKGKRTGK